MRPRLVPKAANWFFITVGSVGCELRQRENEHMTERREFRPIGSFHRVFISQARSGSARVEPVSPRFSTLVCDACFAAGCDSPFFSFLNNFA